MRKTALDFVKAPRWPARWLISGEVVEVVGRFHFLVKSKSEKNVWHCVDLEAVDEQGGGCTCTSYRVRGVCRHYALVARKLGLDTKPG